LGKTIFGSITETENAIQKFFKSIHQTPRNKNIQQQDDGSNNKNENQQSIREENIDMN